VVVNPPITESPFSSIPPFPPFNACTLWLALAETVWTFAADVF